MGLFALLALLCVDAWTDHHLDGNFWGYTGGILVAIWGPPVLMALPDVIRNVLGKDKT